MNRKNENSILSKYIRLCYAYTKPYLLFYIEGLISILLLDICGVILPFLTGEIIDSGFLQKNFTIVIKLSILIFTTVIITSVLSESRTYIQGCITQKIKIRSMSDFIKHIFLLPQKYFDNHRTGETFSRIDDVNITNDFISLFFYDFLRSLIKFTIYIIAAFYINWLLAIMSLVIIPLYVLISQLYSEYNRKREKGKWTIETELNSTLLESIANLRFIKAQAFEYQVTAYILHIIIKLSKYVIQTHFVQSLFKLGLGILSHLESTLIIIIGAALYINDLITIGDWFAYQLIALKLKEPIQSLLAFNKRTKAKSVALNRYTELKDTDRDSESEKKIQIIGGSVEFSKVSFEYNKENKVLDGVNILIREKSFTAIVGKSGAGKTTILNLILGLYNPTAGKILIDDQYIHEYSKESIRSQVGIVLQDPYFFKGTIYQNLTYGLNGIEKEDVIDACKIVNADIIFKNYRLGIDSIVSEKGNNFSRGEKQRLMLARIFLKKPNIIILDEPTSSLDSISKKRILESLKLLNKNCTIIIITHDSDTVLEADNILLLDNMKVIASGSHEELFNFNECYKKLFSNNFISIPQ